MGGKGAGRLGQKVHKQVYCRLLSKISLQGYLQLPPSIYKLIHDGYNSRTMPLSVCGTY